MKQIAGHILAVWLCMSCILFLGGFPQTPEGKIQLWFQLTKRKEKGRDS